MESDALRRVMARLDEPVTHEPHQPSNDNTPAPLRAALGHDLSQVRWRKMGPNLGYVTLYRRGPLAVRLLRGAPRTDVGSHSHRGMEYTLVLRGGYTDATGSYGPGDFQTASAELRHNPVADPEEDCINLSVTTGPLHFDNTVQKIVARLFGF
jgi:putative transcriptional regulator